MSAPGQFTHPDRVPIYRARMVRDYLARFGTLSEYRAACERVARVEIDPACLNLPRGNNTNRFPWRTT